jgi:outer membrane protein assembly factor BamB
MRRLCVRVSILMVFASALAVRAEDWPQFRGPAGQGQSSETGLPLAWTETENIRWKVPITGLGWSSPVVAAGQVWLTAALEKQDPISLRVLAFDAATGKARLNVEVFTVEADPLLNPRNSYASPTLIVDGDRVYVHFGPYGTAALTLAGEALWKTRLPYDPEHGNGGSPALWGDLLIVNCDGIEQNYVTALDAKTGAVRWKTPRRKPSGHAYSTPLVIRVGIVDQVVSVGAFHTAAYEPRTGRELWHVDYAEGYSNVPRPVFGNGLVYIATGLQRPVLTAIRPDGAGNVTNSHVAWRVDRGVPVTSSPILTGGEIYMQPKQSAWSTDSDQVMLARPVFFL